MTYDIDIDSYIGYPISKGYIRAKLEPKKGKPCAVRINSFGGSVADALDIRQQFLDHGDVTAYIFGMTASAATILAMGAKKIAMSKYALMLVHRCSGWVDTWGRMNAEELEQEIAELRKQQADLEKIDEVMANLYALRSGKKPEEMAAVMAEDRWLSAEECKKFGLIDEIIEEGEQTAVTAQMREHFAACGMPIPEAAEEKPTLMKRIVTAAKSVFQAANPDGNAEAADNDTLTKTNIEMNKTIYSALLACLAVESLAAAEDGSITLSASQLETLDAALSKAKADAAAQAEQISSLQNELITAQATRDELRQQVENLQKTDGADTSAIEDGKGEETAAVAERMFKATAELV